jgi:hypothetical protein
MSSSAAGFAEKTTAGCSGFPVHFLYRPDSVPELAALATSPYLAGRTAARRNGKGTRCRLAAQDFASQDLL